MSEENKTQLTEEEKIERKTKLFRLISRILIGVAVVVIAVFVIFAFGTKKNIDMQTAINTQVLRSKLKQIISLQIKYHKEHGEYAKFNYLQLCKKIPYYNPDVEGNFKYKFDPKTGIATGVEKNASHDVNGDIDGNDGLILSVEWEADVIKGSAGSNFFWTDQDKEGFNRRAGKTQ